MGAFVIHNPAAGEPASAARLGRLLRRLPDHELGRTGAAGDAARMAAAAAAAGHHTIVAAGGDGLVSEVVNGLAPAPDRVRLGILPLGTGNDFARGLGLPLDPAAALDTILAGRERTVDAARLSVPEPEGTTGTGGGGRVRPRWFVNAVVAGLAGRIARRAARSRKRLWRSSAYRLAALPEVARSRPVETRLVLDVGSGEETLELQAHAAAVANGPRAGGGVLIAPAARLDDGWLDVVLVPDLPRTELVVAVLRLLAGRGDGGRLRRWRARRVRLEMPGGAWLDADGEAVAGRAATLEVIPGALRVLAP